LNLKFCTAFVEEKAEGKVEGKLENSIEIAKNMKSAGYTNSDISKMTGLSVNEMKKL